MTDQVLLGVWFYPKGYEPKYKITGLGGRSTRDSMRALNIPPRKVTVHHSHIPLAENNKILTFQPHMHLRGKANVDGSNLS